MSLPLYLGLGLGGLPVGGLYALQGMGIVLIYRTTKVFTFAQAGLGVFAAFFAASLHKNGFPLFICAILGVASAVLASILIEVTSIRYAKGDIQKTVVTLGWLLGLQGLSALFFGLTGGNAANVVSTGKAFSWKYALFFPSYLDVACVVVALAAGIGLAIFLKTSATGTAMRGVSDDPEAARLLGLPVQRVAMISWAVGGALAGLSGVLAAPKLGLDQNVLLVFTVESIAVALVARLDSLPIALGAGFALAVVQPMLTTALNVSNGIPELTALIVALASLVLRRRRGRADSGGAGLPPAAIRPLPTSSRAVVAASVVIGLIVLVPFLFGHDGANQLVGVGVWAIATLSLVVLAGVVGQISICTGAFMGIGGFTAAVATQHSVPFVFALALGALVASGAAALVALPAIRLEPLELAIATISLSFAADRFLFAQSFVVGSGKRTVKTPGYFNDLPAPTGSGAAGDRHLAWLVFGLLAVVALAAANLRRGRTGASLTALRSSRAATAAMGFSVASAKLRGFATSGLIAGLAGGLLIVHLGTLQAVNGTTQPYDTTASITLLAYAVIGGLGNLPGALVGGVLVELPTILAGSNPNPTVTYLTTLLSGVVLVVIVVLLPDGIVDAGTRLVRTLFRGGGGAAPAPVTAAEQPSRVLVGAG